mmetsp:Transcript_6988/g.16972  ORF Transcript_6988/g.16972 Transcript_6988/m.16972 type:complete len:245 (+) Transcript_6988:954-1688(+)
MLQIPRHVRLRRMHADLGRDVLRLAPQVIGVRGHVRDADAQLDGVTLVQPDPASHLRLRFEILIILAVVRHRCFVFPKHGRDVLQPGGDAAHKLLDGVLGLPENLLAIVPPAGRLLRGGLDLSHPSVLHDVVPRRLAPAGHLVLRFFALLPREQLHLPFQRVVGLRLLAPLWRAGRRHLLRLGLEGLRVRLLGVFAPHGPEGSSEPIPLVPCCDVTAGEGANLHGDVRAAEETTTETTATAMSL